MLSDVVNSLKDRLRQPLSSWSADSLDRRTVKTVALSGVLLVLLVAFVWLMVRYSRIGDRPSPEQYITYHLKCLECGHEFERRKGDMPAEARTAGPVPVVDTRALRADCPDCGKSRSAAMMATCYACRKRYVSAFTTAPPGQTPTSDVCPHCNTDVMAGVPKGTPLEPPGQKSGNTGSNSQRKTGRAVPRR